MDLGQGCFQLKNISLQGFCTRMKEPNKQQGIGEEGTALPSWLGDVGFTEDLGGGRAEPWEGVCEEVGKQAPSPL